MNHLFAKARVAQGAIVECRIVKPGTITGTVAQAEAETESLVGIALQFNNPVDGQRLDVAYFGPAKLELGGNVSDGDMLTSDAQGRGIVAVRHTHTENVAAAYAQNAATAAAPVQRSICMAITGGALGDIVDVVVVPGLA